MAATIKIKNSSTASAVPTSSDLVQGELAVNVTDKRLFTENASGTVVELGTNPTILTLPDGSASAPTLTNDGDTNTGIFFPAADTVGITTGGTERARVDSAGNLGLGVTPSAWGSINRVIDVGASSGQMSVYGRTDGANDSAMTLNAYRDSSNVWRYKANGYAQNFNFSSGGYYWNTAASGTAGNVITFTQAMTLDASGNLGVGTTSPSGTIGAGYTSRLTAYASSNAAINIKDVNGDWFLGTTSANLTFYSNTAGAERARIDSSGNFNISSGGSIGTTANSSGIYFGGNAVLPSSGTALSDNGKSFGNASWRWTTIYAVTGTINTSDVNQKQDIQELTDAEHRVAVAIKGLIRTFRFKDAVVQKGDAARIHVGVIAQSVKAAFEAEGLDANRYALFCSDTWVDEETNEEKTRLGIRYEELLAFVIAAI